MVLKKGGELGSFTEIRLLGQSVVQSQVCQLL